MTIEEFLKMQENISNQLMEPTSNAYLNLPVVLDSMSSIQQKFIDLYSNIDYQEIITALTSLEQSYEEMLNTTCISVLDSLSDILMQAEAYLPPRVKEESGDIVFSNLKSKHGFALSDAVAILSLLVSIFFGIVSSMPDDQAERIITQNEIIIEQQKEIIQLQKEDKELSNILQSLSDNINLLSDEIELLREEIKGSDNIPSGSSQFDAKEGQ